MKRLVLDSGALIGLLSKKDKYHQEAKRGFSQIPDTFGEVLTPLPMIIKILAFLITWNFGILVVDYSLPSLNSNQNKLLLKTIRDKLRASVVCQSFFGSR